MKIKVSDKSHSSQELAMIRDGKRICNLRLGE